MVTRLRPAFVLLSAVCLVVSCGTGCQTKAPPAVNNAQAPADHHDHGDHGPHGGHIIALNPGHVHVEWTHDDKNLITVYLDDLDATPTEVKFTVKIGDAEPQSFPLTKSESKEPADAFAYSLTSDALLTHINMGEAAKVTLVVKTADAELTALVEHEDEHGHKH